MIKRSAARAHSVLLVVNAFPLVQHFSPRRKVNLSTYQPASVSCGDFSSLWITRCHNCHYSQHRLMIHHQAWHFYISPFLSAYNSLSSIV